MSRGVLRQPLRVCSVAQNYLAEAYLTHLLSKSPGIHVLHLRPRTKYSSPHGRDIIYVIDQYGLEMPLSECLKQLRAQSPDAKFLVLNHHKSKEEIVRILILGAHGYVAHTEAASTLIRAVFCVASNQLWIPPEVFPEFLREVSRVLCKNGRSRQTTTPREDEVLELARRRLSNKEIADLLQIRVSTVKFHLSNILSKLRLNNRRELVRATLQNVWGYGGND